MLFRLVMFCCALVWTYTAAGEADAPITKRLAGNLQICANCHGPDVFEKLAVDNYLVPRLGGQQAGYIIKALKQYRTRKRYHFFMRGIAAGLSEEEMAELAAYFSEQPTTAGELK